MHSKQWFLSHIALWADDQRGFNNYNKSRGRVAFFFASLHTLVDTYCYSHVVHDIVFKAGVVDGDVMASVQPASMTRPT